MLLKYWYGNDRKPDEFKTFRALGKREYLIIFFLFLIETICCDPLYEPSHRDGSDEQSQHMFLCSINKIYL